MSIADNNEIPRRKLLRAAPLGMLSSPGIALASQPKPGANDRLGVACVGVGTRGIELLRLVQECPNTEVRVICDLYDGHLKRALETSFNKKAQLTKEWEKAIASSDVDVVVIATPDFWHARMAICAAQMKKHLYVEKALCRTLDEAKGIRTAVRENKVTLQLGHHLNSDPAHIRAGELVRAGKLGKIPTVRCFVDRARTYPEWQFYGDFNRQQPPEGAGPNNIAWDRFLANAPKRPFDLERFFRWRCWWDYGTGIAGDLMSHSWDAVNMMLGMGIPEGVQTQGGLYFWKSDREVPDVWNVQFEYSKQDLAMTFTTNFHNSHQGNVTFLLGRDGTIEVGPRRCRLHGAEWKPGYSARLGAARKAAQAAGLDPVDAVPRPEYSFQEQELHVTNHMRDFIDCVRSGATPRCGMDRAFQEAVTLVMSVESYFRERKMKWDSVNEQVV